MREEPVADELNELYQQVILDHCRKPRNFHLLPGANHTVEGKNPLCGDNFTIFLNSMAASSATSVFKAPAAAFPRPPPR